MSISTPLFRFPYCKFLAVRNSLKIETAQEYAKSRFIQNYFIR